MTKFSKTDLGILPYLRWSSLQQLVTMGLKTNGQCLYVTAVTRSSLLTKLKLDENGHALKAASDTLSYFADTFLHFFESADYLLTEINLF